MQVPDEVLREAGFELPAPKRRGRGKAAEGGEGRQRADEELRDRSSGMPTDMDAVFRALADPTRRELLDALNRRNEQNLGELRAGLDIRRQSVAKNLAVMDVANLVATVRQGREKLHYLNAAPIHDISERWIGRYDPARLHALADLRKALEEPPVNQTEFVYISYIETTPEKLWQALTDPAFIDRYFENTGPRSDWQVGSAVLWKSMPDDEHRDLNQVVLEADPPRRLSYTWHTYQPEHKELFGWSDEQFARLLEEKRSKVTFEIEAVGEGTVKLTVTHDDFEPDSEMLNAISQGWPAILSNLKSLLETGRTLPFPDDV